MLKDIELQVKARHKFEYMVIPYSIYDDKDALTNYIRTEDAEAIESLLKARWLVAVIEAIDSDGTKRRDLTPEQHDEFARHMYQEHGKMHEQHILTFDIECLYGGAKVLIIEMRDAKTNPYSTFMGIVLTKTHELNLYMLESRLVQGDGLDEQQHIFGAFEGYEFIDYGTLRNSKAAFMYAIESNLLEEVSSSGEEESPPNPRYLFEQCVLPMHINDYTDILNQQINDCTLEELQRFIFYYWHTAVLSSFGSDLTAREVLEDDSMRDELYKIMQENDWLPEQHINDITLETITSDAKAVIIKMMDIDQERISSYLGIVQIKPNELQWFTLEKGTTVNGKSPDPSYVFCSIVPLTHNLYDKLISSMVAGVEAEHYTRGQYGYTENNKESFMEAIREHLAGEPLSGTARFFDRLCDKPIDVDKKDV